MPGRRAGVSLAALFATFAAFRWQSDLLEAGLNLDGRTEFPFDFYKPITAKLRRHGCSRETSREQALVSTEDFQLRGREIFTPEDTEWVMEIASTSLALPVSVDNDP